MSGLNNPTWQFKQIARLKIQVNWNQYKWSDVKFCVGEVCISNSNNHAAEVGGKCE